MSVQEKKVHKLILSYCYKNAQYMYMHNIVVYWLIFSDLVVPIPSKIHFVSFLLLLLQELEEG